MAMAERSRTKGTEPPPEVPSEEQAAAVAGVQEEQELAFSTRAISDLPSAEDVLGFAPLVRGLDSLLNDPRTRLPLAIAVTAPWGAGKSSVMLQLRELLARRARTASPGRSWRIVSFAAWKYERSERLWAALGKAIYDQPQAGMGPLERVRFRVRLERERRGALRFALAVLTPTVAAIVALVGAVSADLVHPAGGAAPTAGALAGLAGFATGAARYWGVASSPFKRAIDRHAGRPKYQEQLGFTTEAEQDIATLMHVLAPRASDAIAIFVDDLDRCSSQHIVEAVESMNQIFNADHDRSCVFVLGVDREVVVAGIDVFYRDTVDYLQRAGSGLAVDFGFEFLSKLVQLSVAVPRPTPGAMRNLLDYITGDVAPSASPTTQEVAEAAEKIRSESSSSWDLAALTDAAARVAEKSAGTAAAAEAARQLRAASIRDSPAVAAAEREVLPYLPRNPRQLKRFDNAFRLQLYVANEATGTRLAFTPDDLIALGKWVALRLRWPRLADLIDDERWLLALLEADANEVEKVDVPAADQARVRSEYADWFNDRHLTELLVENEPARRLTSLPWESFLQVT